MLSAYSYAFRLPRCLFGEYVCWKIYDNKLNPVKDYANVYIFLLSAIEYHKICHLFQIFICFMKLILKPHRKKLVFWDIKIVLISIQIEL